MRIEATTDRGVAVGTGFVIDARGLIATNLHVVAATANIKVRLYMNDGSTYPVVSIAGVDPGRDLALMWIKPGKPLPVLALGDSDGVVAGDPIYAIGNPLGVFDYSVTDGLISQVRTLCGPDLTVLQISAPISQGSSGGPLFNQFGDVVGVTTAIITEGQNINLAVPANYLRPMVKQPQAIGLAEFAKATKDIAEEHGEHEASDAGDDGVQIHRMVPVPSGRGVGRLQPERYRGRRSEAISEAIANGAPLYNAGNHEACYRIYEGTAIKYEKDASCKGVRSAFGDGLLRASSMSSFKEKAWAMRDTFDGLIDAARRWAQRIRRQRRRADSVL